MNFSNHQGKIAKANSTNKTKTNTIINVSNSSSSSITPYQKPNWTIAIQSNVVGLLIQLII